MNRAEAREVIETSDLFWFRPTDEEREALDLAIEALEREIEYGQMVVDLTKGEKVDDWVYDEDESATTTDCISRRQAIEAIEKEIERIRENPCAFTEGDFYYQNALKLAQEIIELQPTVTPTEQKTTETMMIDGEPTEIDPLSYEVGYTHGQSERLCEQCGADMRGEK